MQSDSNVTTCACRMAVTLSADLSLEMYQLHTVVWVMTSWVMSQRNGMTTCYQCDRLSTLLPISPQPVLLSSDFSLHDTLCLSGVSSLMDASRCEQHWSPMACLIAVMLFCFLFFFFFSKKMQ